MLAPSDREALEALMARGRLPRGMARRYGLSRFQIYNHRHHPPGRITRPYFAPKEWQRRRERAERIKAWRWKPGQSGGGRKPKGVPNKRPMRPSMGIKAAIKAERAERAAGRLPR